jgi:hypothetical protein
MNTIKKLREIRRLLRRNRPYGEVADKCNVPLHEVVWCTWLKAYALRDAAPRFQEVQQRVKAWPFGKDGLALMRSRRWFVANSQTLTSEAT